MLRIAILWLIKLRIAIMWLIKQKMTEFTVQIVRPDSTKAIIWYLLQGQSEYVESYVWVA